ncbi:two-partner secretion domain-containing protein [Nostoc sp. 'Peltigera membranacea cyanobiont' 213]|uniref:two-partner secretion domain-containing protein n=2 Tax=Nostoc cyanobionts TaxID=3123326 RepID=UPI00167CDE80|nr:filamentous hemagglutinin N-terminal domain-containing protein [Nostoc sp. 'Peltigera membranacea cyanobiont' 213]
MKVRTISFWGFQGSILSSLLLILSPAIAQITPDKTLPVNSQVIRQDNTNQINGGTIKGNNLFHSFEQFSVLTGTRTYFNNSANIQNIFTRITGNSISNIDGILKANGIANLFLLNRNGIIFGKNARLEIGGSFFASTANAIKFSDGFEWRMNPSQTTPLLTISTPIGLQIGNNSGAIQINGTGLGLIAQSTIISPYRRNKDATGLQVQPGKTLALVGGELTLEGGTLSAEQGRIELGAVNSGFVSLSSITQEWALRYEEVSFFKDINLSQKSLLDTSGSSSGSIALQGKSIFLSSGSVLLDQNLGSFPSGNININAIESFQVSGSAPVGKFISFVGSESLGSGSGASIDILTQHLVIQAGAGISTRTYSTGQGGNININATKSVQLLGFLPLDPLVTSGIITTTFGTQKAGNIAVSTGKLLNQDGGLIASLTTGIGDGGDIVLNATDSIELTNSPQLINSGQYYVPSYLASQTFNTGISGNLTINTSRLIVGDQAFANTSTLGFGDAGTLTINASDMEISGSIGASTTKADMATQELFGSPPMPSGSPGEVNINARYLSLTNGGQVNITNEGTSTAGGKLTIHADSIFLNNKSSITASTASGVGGDIQVNVIDLLLNNKSYITASADNQGDGGNIRINADIISGSKNSSIAADAFEGRGGNITINAQGLFFSADSLITASSKYGINGTVKYNILEPNIYTTKIKAEVIPITPQITAVCPRQVGTGRSSFVVNSRNLQSKPNNLMYNNVEDSNSLPVPAFNNSQNPKLFFSNQPTQVIEANVLIRDSQGNLVLTTDQANPTWDNASLSASSCFSGSQW